MTEPTAEYPSPEELQALVAHGDYYHALHLLGCPGFTPGDGSWTEWILLQMYRHRTHDSTTFDPVDPVDPVNSKVDTAPAYLQLVAKLFPLPMDHHDRSWRCYYDLCAYFQQPVQPFQFYTTFLSVPPNQLALSMTRRSDLHGLDILLSYFPMGCTVFPSTYQPLVGSRSGRRNRHRTARHWHDQTARTITGQHRQTRDGPGHARHIPGRGQRFRHTERREQP